MSLEGFYRIDEIRQAECGYTMDVTLFAGHGIYEGHFPERAVVPGVCTLTVIRAALSEALGRRVRFSFIKECKFLSALLPEKDLNLVIEAVFKGEDQIRCNVLKDNNVVLKLNAAISDI
ncbi:MAG: beta-hydroxyacyl-ACP dehydratase [Bacteroidales bacterium]|nr:beta-hydroxyacyl-ACP dehydratase [Bacteroidales bacterium]